MGKMGSLFSPGENMITVSLVIDRAGYAVIQDLGRPGLAKLGVSANGAGDQVSARLANILVGNAETSPVIEVISSEIAFTPNFDVLMSITGAARTVFIDELPHATHETIVVDAGSRVVVPGSEFGQRTYIGLNGKLQGDRILGSVAPDGFLEFGKRLTSGLKIELQSNFTQEASGNDFPVFRFSAPHDRYSHNFNLTATIGPDISRLKNGVQAFAQEFQVLPQSDHVGMRLSGTGLDLDTAGEILSRGVPIGAVEVPPSGELIILLRGRLVTAGYPVVAVLTKGSIDKVSQARPGDQISISLIEMDKALVELQEIESRIVNTKTRVKNAFISRGWDSLLSY
jgi:biotin-dependent carboxylase-like uncharacterized protein